MLYPSGCMAHDPRGLKKTAAATMVLVNGKVGVVGVNSNHG